MVRIIIVVILGAVLFLSGAWYLRLFEDSESKIVVDNRTPPTVPEDQLGDYLYKPAVYPLIPPGKRSAADPTILYGVLNPINQEEVPSRVNGVVMFLGEQVDDAVVLAAGSAPFLAEPYYPTQPIFTGRDSFIKFYRRIYEGEIVNQNQMLAMIEPAEALGDVLAKASKIAIAKSESEGADHSEQEGRTRYERALRIYRAGQMGDEEFGTHRLTYLKLKSEAESKKQGVLSTLIEKDQADIKLKMHEIRPVLQYNRLMVRSIVKQTGSAVKQLDPVLVVYNLDKLQAEAQIEEQYYRSLPKHVTATIEPSILEKPKYAFEGHRLDVTTVAVTNDMKIVSGSEDRTVCVWDRRQESPLHELRHDDAIRVLTCTGPKSDKNLCLVGTAAGTIYLWDLAGKEPAQIKVIEKAHGPETAITSLAFCGEDKVAGKLFASGAADGSIQMWSLAADAEGKLDAMKLYAFVPQNGVAQCHEDAVTALAFTPQCRLISASRDKTMRVWKLRQKGAALDGQGIKDRDGNVARLGVSHDGRWMLFDQMQGRTLKLLSIESHAFKHTISVPANSTSFDTFALFSPDSSLVLTAGAPEGRMQLWKTPDETSRAFEVRQFGTRDKSPVTCAAFSPDAGNGGPNSFAVSGSGHKIHVWTIPTGQEVSSHRVERVRMTLKTQTIDSATRTARIGFEVLNPVTEQYPNGRFEAGRPVTIVIE